MQLYNEQYQVGEKGIQREQLEKKKSTRKFNTGAQACSKRHEETLDAKWNKGSVALGARPHPASLQHLEKAPEMFLVLKKATNQSSCKCNSRRESDSI